MQASEAPPCPTCGSVAQKIGERHSDEKSETTYTFRCARGHEFSDTVKDEDQDTTPV
jgi:hypothetical protein